MSVEENKALMRRFFQAFEMNDQVTLKNLLAPDFVANLPGAYEQIDREAFLQNVIGAFKAAFGEQKYTIEVQIAEGNRVATLATWRATHTGEFQGQPPTGKQIVLSGMAMDRIRDDKIVEHWARHDQFDFMRQLGLVPPAE